MHTLYVRRGLHVSLSYEVDNPPCKIAQCVPTDHDPTEGCAQTDTPPCRNPHSTYTQAISQRGVGVPGNAAVCSGPRLLRDCTQRAFLTLALQSASVGGVWATALPGSPPCMHAVPYMEGGDIHPCRL